MREEARDCGPAYGKLVERRKREMKEHNDRTFGGVSIGIHTRELPKFAQNEGTAQYWKLRGASYVPRPAIQSHTQLLHSIKYNTARPDDVAPKITQVNFSVEYPAAIPKEKEVCSSGQPSPKPVRKGPRWTTIVQKFACRPKGAYEDDYSNNVSRRQEEDKPLYSSFSPAGVFADPLDQPRLQRQAL